MDDRWMRALLRPLDLLAFLSMTPVPSDARTPHPGRVPPARRPIPGRASDGGWTVRWPLPAPGRGGIQGDLEEAEQEEVLTWEGRGNY